jgi:hypothetical protein
MERLVFVFGDPVRIVRRRADGSYDLGGIEYLKETLEGHLPMVGDKLTYIKEDSSYVLEGVERHLVDDARYAKRSWCLIVRQVDRSTLNDRLVTCLRNISSLHAKATHTQKKRCGEDIEPAKSAAEIALQSPSRHEEAKPLRS